MNTQSVLFEDRMAFYERIRDLLYADGFGFDEAEAHATGYAEDIFGNASPTAILRVKQALAAMRKETLQ